MNALIITLRLESPLLITGLGNGEENSSQSLSFIPGSTLRGLLVSRYKASSADLFTDQTAKKLFFSGKVRFLNAYLQDSSGKRTLPTPASWRVAKGSDLTNAAAGDFAIQFDETKETGIGKSFWGQNADATCYVISPDEELSIHIASQNRGIVKQGESTVFQYQALARGQRFVAVVVSEDVVDLQDVKDLLEDKTLYLGRSRSAGYGKVIVEKTETDNDWHETTQQDPKATTITLLSDALLRDEHGQPTHNLDAYLSRRLNQKVEHQAAFIRSNETGGFNRKWGLPLLQFPSLGMGSVFVYPASQLSANDLKDLVESGIGERRVDGFGQIAVNWLEKATIQLQKVSRTSAPEPMHLSSSSQKLAVQMAGRLLERALENNLVAETNRFSIQGNLTNYQLSRLRVVLRRAIDQKATNFSGVETFFGSLKKSAEEQWNKTRLVSPAQSSRFRLWLNERIEKKDGLDLLDMKDVGQFPEVAGQHTSISDEIKIKYTLRLMEAVVDRAMKQNRIKEA